MRTQRNSNRPINDHFVYPKEYNLQQDPERKHASTNFNTNTAHRDISLKLSFMSLACFLALSYYVWDWIKINWRQNQWHGFTRNMYEKVVAIRQFVFRSVPNFWKSNSSNCVLALSRLVMHYLELCCLVLSWLTFLFLFYFVMSCDCLVLSWLVLSRFLFALSWPVLSRFLFAY